MHNGNYPPNHPVSIALSAAMTAVNCGREVHLKDVDEAASGSGVLIGGPAFDLAAAMVGLPYSPSYDAYLDPETWRAVEMPFPNSRVPVEVIAEMRSQPS